MIARCMVYQRTASNRDLRNPRTNSNFVAGQTARDPSTVCRASRSQQRLFWERPAAHMDGRVVVHALAGWTRPAMGNNACSSSIHLPPSTARRSGRQHCVRLRAACGGKTLPEVVKVICWRLHVHSCHALQRSAATHLEQQDARCELAVRPPRWRRGRVHHNSWLIRRQ
jgi:hypothetical protein